MSHSTGYLFSALALYLSHCILESGIMAAFACTVTPYFGLSTDEPCAETWIGILGYYEYPKLLFFSVPTIAILYILRWKYHLTLITSALVIGVLALLPVLVMLILAKPMAWLVNPLEGSLCASATLVLLLYAHMRLPSTWRVSSPP